MKIAVCTSDGNKVDLHFGKTSTFYVYEIEKGEKNFIDKRDVGAYCSSENKDHGFKIDKFEMTYQALKDCKKLYTASIGDTPKLKFEEKGIEVKLCSCDIDSIPTCSGNCKH